MLPMPNFSFSDTLSGVNDYTYIFVDLLYILTTVLPIHAHSDHHKPIITRCCFCFVGIL